MKSEVFDVRKRSVPKKFPSVNHGDHGVHLYTVTGWPRRFVVMLEHVSLSLACYICIKTLHISATSVLTSQQA